MSTQSLAQAAVEIVDRYQQAAKHLVGACQAGIERAARAERERLTAAVERAASPLADEAFKSSVLEAHRRGAELVVTGLRAGTAALDGANERIARGVKTGIERIADAGGRFGTAFDNGASDTLALFGLPAARLQLSLANAFAEGAQRIEARVASDGAAAEAAEARPAAKKTARRG